MYNATSVFFDLSKDVLWASEYYNARAIRFSPFNALLDIDLSGNPTKFDALTDGLLIIRYLFLLSDQALTPGAIGGTATRANAAQIRTYLDSIRPALDIDNDGKQDALTDGLLLLRYMFGLRNATLISNAVAPGATRTTSAAIEAYIQTLMQ